MKKIFFTLVIFLSFFITFSQNSFNNKIASISPCNFTLTATQPSAPGICDGTLIIDFSQCTNSPFDIFIPQNGNNPNFSVSAIASQTYTITGICGSPNPFSVLVTNSAGESNGGFIAIPNPATTTMNELSEKNIISINPNPAKDVIELSLIGSDNLNDYFEITNIIGQVVLSSPLVGSKTQIFNIQDLHQGIYFVKVFTRNKLSGYKKIIVEK
ncbi:MAG: T9SS type A sorting domain-containing protein [Bacteroidia bacterium]|nr:T9SS type A sorting domain-containing protein [Bacteroidia bacterium]